MYNFSEQNFLSITYWYIGHVLIIFFVSIPKDKAASLSNSDNYRGIYMFNSIHNYLIMLLLIYVAILCQQVICSMVIRIIIQLLCVL